MSINIADNMGYNGKKPLDNRTQYATLALMKAVTDANINEGCLAYCAETDKYYKFLSTNSVDASTGKWREFESGGGGGTSDYPDLTNKPSINNVTLNGNKSLSDLGITKSGLGLGNVVNTGDSATPTNGGTTKFTTGGAYTLKQSIDKAYKSDDTAETALADADKFPFYDSSASAKRSSTWSNIKSVLKTYFDTLYNKVTNGTGLTLTNGTMAIKEFENGDMDDVIPELPEGNVLVSIANSFNRGDIYSTSERMIGQWQDGRPLYQKTVSIGTLPNATQKTVAHGISNLKDVISFEGWCYMNGTYYKLPALSTVSADQNVNIFINSSNIIVGTAYNYSSITTSYVTLQYTKTTDSSISIGEENEYSTSEKIVGTWLNGEKLYQKTVSYTFTSNYSQLTPVSVSLGVTNISVVNIRGCCLASGYFAVLPYQGSDNVNILSYEDGTSSTGKINLTVKGNWNGETIYLTIQYTKS